MTEKPVVGRFAPSPSGRMHMGNIFSMLLAWLSVRSKNGKLILRLEDLDPERCKKEYCAQLEDDLRWLGLDWDEGGLADRPDYRQSNCTELYEEALEKLSNRGLLYPCFCSRGELHAASAPHATDGTILYAGTCRNLTEGQIRDKMLLRNPAVRIRVPERTIGFTDGHYGYYEENLQTECGDFILRRSDAVYAYQLAVVVDDGRMGVTEIVRGRDLLESTPRQLWLQEELELPHPGYYHLPLLTAKDGKRLAKRNRDMDMGTLRKNCTPEQIIGHLAFLAGILEEDTCAKAQEIQRIFDWKKVKTENIVINNSLSDS